MRSLDESARNESANNESDDIDKQRSDAFFSNLNDEILKSVETESHKESLENRSIQTKKPTFQQKR